MEMCPYCGEEVPDDSSRCWKCGTEISESAAKPAGDDLEVPDDDDDDDGSESGEPRIEVVECPHCGSTQPKKATRCRECGRMLKAVKTVPGVALWKYGTWAAVALVGI